MGAKSPGQKGGGKGKKTGPNGHGSGGQISVILSVDVARTLLSSLTAGTPPAPDVAKTVALALVRALNAGPITKKKGGKVSKKLPGKKAVGKKGAPVGNPKKGAPPGLGKKTPVGTGKTSRPAAPAP